MAVDATTIPDQENFVGEDVSFDVSAYFSQTASLPVTRQAGEVFHGPTIKEGPIQFSEPRQGWDSGRQTVNLHLGTRRNWRQSLPYNTGDFAPGAGLSFVAASWSSATAYVVDQWLTYNSNHYRCIQDHTAASTSEPGLGEDWQEYWETIPPMYVVGRSATQIAGGHFRAELDLLGSADPLVNGVAKIRRTQIDGGTESITVEPAISAYVDSTKSMWAHNGTDWVDTGQGGAPSAGQLSVASESGLPNAIGLSVPGGSAGASPGGRIRFLMPRVSFQDQFICSSDAVGIRSNSFQRMGWGTFAIAPNVSVQNLGGGDGNAVPFDTSSIPAFSTFSFPPQFDGIQMPYGWVLTARAVEPLLDANSPLSLVTDTYTYYQRKEFM